MSKNIYHLPFELPYLMLGRAFNEPVAFTLVYDRIQWVLFNPSILNSPRTQLTTAVPWNSTTILYSVFVACRCSLPFHSDYDDTARGHSHRHRRTPTNRTRYTVSICTVSEWTRASMLSTVCHTFAWIGHQQHQRQITAASNRHANNAHTHTHPFSRSASTQHVERQRSVRLGCVCVSAAFSLCLALKL